VCAAFADSFARENPTLWQGNNAKAGILHCRATSFRDFPSLMNPLPLWPRSLDNSHCAMIAATWHARGVDSSENDLHRVLCRLGRAECISHARDADRGRPTFRGMFLNFDL
jgi:hypothetical protein